MDSEIAFAYKSTRAGLSQGSAALVQNDQREWLHWLDSVCPASAPSAKEIGSCLSEHYASRRSQLNQGVQQVAGITFFARAHFVFVAGKASAKDDVHGSNDRGFGYGEFAWPQIDNPTPAQAAWNTAVHDAAIKIEGAKPESKAQTFDAAVDPDGYSFGFYTLRSANTHLIDVDLGISTYGWGAAHPLTDVSGFIWWMDARRALTAADVFQQGSGWQRKLIEPAIRKLPVDPGQDNIWKGEELLKAVMSGLANVNNWSVSAGELSVTFGQYSVGPYALGMPSIHFTWDELRPLLAPGFSAATLPAELPETK